MRGDLAHPLVVVHADRREAGALAALGHEQDGYPAVPQPRQFLPAPAGRAHDDRVDTHALQAEQSPLLHLGDLPRLGHDDRTPRGLEAPPQPVGRLSEERVRDVEEHRADEGGPTQAQGSCGRVRGESARLDDPLDPTAQSAADALGVVEHVGDGAHGRARQACDLPDAQLPVAVRVHGVSLSSGNGERHSC